MNLEKIFQKEDEKNEAIEHFKALKDNPDWIFLREKLIHSDIEEITNKILDPETEWKEGEEKEQKRIRAYWIILSQLPEKLIESLLSSEDDIFADPDPYFKTTKEIKDSNNKQ